LLRFTKNSGLGLNPNKARAEDERGLRRFGLALVRDDRFVRDESAAEALVDKLCRQALFSVRNDEGPHGGAARLGVFAHFVRLYRRQMRQQFLEEGGDAPVDAAEMSPPRSVQQCVRNLPLPLREALLLVTLADFSHFDAARALDIPLTLFVARLASARSMIGASVTARTGAPPERAPRRGAPHLRLVK